MALCRYNFRVFLRDRQGLGVMVPTQRILGSGVGHSIPTIYKLFFINQLCFVRPKLYSKDISTNLIWLTLFRDLFHHICMSRFSHFRFMLPIHYLKLFGTLFKKKSNIDNFQQSSVELQIYLTVIHILTINQKCIPIQDILTFKKNNNFNF